MRVVAFDTETHLLKMLKVNAKTSLTSMQNPRIVCLSWADETGAGLLDRARGLDWLERKLRDPDVLLVGANTVYDLGCAVADRPSLLPLAFDAYRTGRVRCVQLRQKLIDIAKGELKFRATRGKQLAATHSLAALVDYWLDEHLEKEDTWRLRYALLDGHPLEQWPADARDYALGDAVKTYQVYTAQEMDIHKVTGPWLKRRLTPLADEAHQNRAAWAMHLMASWGVRADAARVKHLEDALNAEHDAAYATLMQEATDAAGKRIPPLVRKDGTKDTKNIRARVEAAFANMGRPVPKTDAGQTKIDEDTLNETNDLLLLTLAAVQSGDNTRAAWLPALNLAARGPLCARYNPIVETGRTSCGSPNMQNPKKKGGLRECFGPREGYWYAGADYDTLELRTLAQELLEMDLEGGSAMADALKQGKDLHLELAAQLMGITAAEAQRRYDAGDQDVSDKRQLCKVANFGFPGGMVPDTFVEYAAGYGYTVSPALAKRLHESWMLRWPEMQTYFDRVKQTIYATRDPLGYGTIVQSVSKRVRGGVGYCAACNTRFQGRAGDGAKEAMWRLAVEQYTGQRTDGKPGVSPLYGSRSVIFMHDEFIVEVPISGAHEAAVRLGEVMREGMAAWVKDIPIKAGPVLMRRWLKGAKAVYVDGRLVPSRRVESQVSGKKLVTWEPDV